jgi:tetratricopeptide (TPR) repeat protein
MITPCLTWAQKKELNQARSYIKSGKEKELEQAEQMMVRLLKESKNKTNKKIYLTRFDAVKGLYLQANERLYLKQKQDTAKFFELNKRMFTILETLDSIEMRPNEKGRVDIEYRKKHAELLHAYRPNLFNAGTYHLRKGEMQKAFDYFEFYIDCSRQPLFSTYRYDSLDTRMPEAAYWATFCGYRMQNAVLTLRHRKLALCDSAKANFTLQYIAEARRWLNDQELYLKTLEEGFRRFPTFTYFFPRLMDAYSQRGEYDKALAAADSAIAVCDTCTLYLFAKSTMLFRLERYGESIKVSEQIIAINPNLAEAHFNAGTGYLNIALRLDERKNKKQLRQLYQKARPYMERYRQLMPNQKEKWGPALYRIYLNLNMGKQFDEIDRLLK